MDKKSVMELKKRFKKEECTITQIYSIYYNAEGQRICSRYENFLIMKENEEKDFYKYLEILKKGISLKSDDLYFINEDDDFKKNLNILNKDKLKSKEVLDVFIDKIAENYLKETMSNILVSLVCDSYDIPTKTTDGFKVDESEEVYSYIFCTICPVVTSKAGLGYVEKDNRISSRYQDFIVNPPEVGFIYPNFIERSSDDTCIAFFNKNPKKEFLSLINNVLGCEKKEEIIEDSLEVSNETNENYSCIEDSMKKEEVVVEYKVVEENDEVKEDISKDKEVSIYKDVSNIKDDIPMVENEENISEKNINDDIIKNIDNNEDIEIVDLNKDDESFDSIDSKTILDNCEQEDEFNKFLKKINLLLDENKGLAEVKIIDGKKFLMIPMD